MVKPGADRLAEKRKKYQILIDTGSVLLVYLKPFKNGG